MDILIQRLAIKDKMVLNKNESILYVGGAGISAALISAIGRFAIALYGWGQNFGSTLRRYFSHTSC